jgi:hypothetical protein
MSIRIEGEEILFSKGVRLTPAERRPLLSGFVCPYCKEILKAYFLTANPLPLREFLKRTGGEDEQYRSLTVPGGQAILSATHEGYYTGCDLEIFWTPSLKHNLIEWLTKHHPNRRFSSLAKAMAVVRAGKVAGLVAIPELTGSEACLLGYDKNKWEGQWNSRTEDYDTYWERKERETEQKLSQLGVVSEE